MLTLIVLILCQFSFGQSKQPVVLGHRGSAGVYPEHTKIAYEKGADFGSDFIECDVQVTKVRIQFHSQVFF